MLDIFDYLINHNIEVIRDDGSELACLCPFHNNTDSPAFYINKSTGLWICFNPACGKRGSLHDLMSFFGEHRPVSFDPSAADIEKLLFDAGHEEERPEWGKAMQSMIFEFPKDRELADYLINRGFTEQTLSYFEVGFSSKKNRIVIPVRDESSQVVGLIGRAITEHAQPKYLYSKGFPRKKVLFNLNHAKRHSSVVVVEGSLDAMKLHQSGFPNVVATLGAAVTDGHIFLMKHYFDEIIIFSDNDDAGSAMRDSIIKNISDRPVRVVEYRRADVKDPNDLSAEEVSEYIASAEDALLSRLSRPGVSVV